MTRGATSGVIACALVAAVVWIYADVRHHDFVNFDDHIFVLKNPNLPLGWTWEGITRAVTTRLEAYWLPLTALSFQASWALHGFAAPGYLIENVALHALATLVLFAAFVRLTGAIGRSAFVAAVFAVHPLHVESVAWVSERKDALAGLGFAVVLLAYAAYAARPTWGRWSVVLVTFALGLLAKPTLVTIPCVLLLLDVWPLARFAPWPSVREKLPLFVLAAASSVGTMVTQRSYGALAFGDTIPFERRLLVALDGFRFYCAKAFWPTGLAAFYPYPSAVPAGQVLLGVLALVGGTLVAMAFARRHAAVAVGWLWWVGMLVPTIGLVQAGMQARADRFAHLPSIGLSVAVAWGVTACLERWPMVLRLGGGVALTALTLVAQRQVAVWRDTITLFEHALTVTTDNGFAHFRLGEAYRDAGAHRQAVMHYQETLRLDPSSMPAVAHLADTHDAMGDLPAAAAGYARVLAQDPNDRETLVRAGRVALRRELPAEAVPYLTRATSLAPNDTEVLNLLGVALARAGDPEAAVRAHRAALAQRFDPWTTNNLAWLLATSTNPSVRDPIEAVRLAESLVGGVTTPHPAWLDTLGAAYAAAARFADAVAVADRGAALASAGGDEAMAAQLRAHAAAYRRGVAVTITSATPPS